ncbi:SH3 and cysteine-rich domain-containing protein isoform X2 [Ochotona princeps]|uniref:SH3 and cysteine-rich domain-containing protein isoform X2 n=1 Tax=Ochotona princeps TaxID=9978 RepID=UPI00271549A2|nr:SH3 and cysteine-rich domain-containing protein isoform X2 [Ochotona princeps]
MIPPSDAREDSVDGLPKEPASAQQPPPSPASTSSQESKTKSLRSKSADNFFQQTNSDVKLHADVLNEVSPSSSPLPALGSLSSPPTRAGLHPSSGKAHAFQEHIFKKPTFCDVCNHMIVDDCLHFPNTIVNSQNSRAYNILNVPSHPRTNAKHGLRCKACKMSIHHKCTDGLVPQRCMGKLPKGFRRYYSSPLLIQEQFGCIKEVMPIACGNKVDPVYETLRFGTSLAQRMKKGSSGSGSDSPHRTSTSDLVEVPEEADGPASGYDLRQRSNSVFTYPENGTDDFRDQAKNINHQGPLSKDPLQMNTYVALYKFVPQENEDLEMRPGDMITLLEDSNEDWWKGKIENRIGFFPANFVQRVQQNEKIFRCVRTFIGCKEQGQITLKENQICVSSEDEQDGFVRVLSGKKRGLVPLDVLENI